MKKLIPESIRKILDDEEMLFRFSIAWKFVLLTAFFIGLTFLVTFMILKVDLIYFQTYGFPLKGDSQNTFYEFVFSSFMEQLPSIAIVFILIFLGGYYVGNIMMRPFKVIGNYCEVRLKSETHFYNPEIFSDLKLLTSFSSFFFAKVDEAKIRGKLERVIIPDDFEKIKRPNVEKNFFLNYSFVIIILGLLGSVGVFMLTNEVRDQLILMSPKLTYLNPQAKFFLDKHFEVFDTGILIILTTHLMLTVFFGFYLYQKISLPAFSIFVAMRSFLQGNYHSRVNTIGYYYLEKEFDKINKYLDLVEKELS